MLAMLSPTRSAPLARRLAAGLSLLLVAGCMAMPAPRPSAAPASAADASATASRAAASTPRPVTPSATPAPKLEPIAGAWRVRKVLSPKHRSALLPGTVFQDEAFVVTADCDMEPCPTIEVKMMPLGRSSPVTTATLDLKGGRYVSAAKAENEGPCLNKDGERVQGGATVTSTLNLWATNARAAGTAVQSTVLMGSIDMDLTPTSIGSSAGCEPQTASYELTGSRGRVAARNPDEELPDEPPNTAGGMATLPSLSVKVSGVQIKYFPIEGDTLHELDVSMANGGVRACGVINYEWHEGDDRPVACAVTGFSDVEAAIDRRTDSAGKCTITESNIKARFTIHFPRWNAPKRVPTRLLAWWRDVIVFIRDHEAAHIRISRDHVKKLNSRLRGAACREADAIITKWAKQLTSAQEEFDRVEYSKPWPVPPFGY
jgi:predicted secreted Zn-dependent protease